MVQRLFCLFCAVLASSCAVESRDEGIKTVFAPLISEKCLNTGAGDLNFPQGVDSVVVRVLKTGGAELFKGKYGKESLSKSGDILITGLAPGSDYTVEVLGCSGSEATWSGKSGSVAISEHMKSSPYVYLTKIGDFSCTGFSGKIGGAQAGSSVMSDMRAFHAAAVDGDGDIFISGGFRNFKVGNLTASAEGSIDFYSEDFSVFFKSGELAAKRGFHSMFPIGSGKLLVAGGIRNAEFKITGPGLPIMPYGKKTDYFPVPFEIFDIENKTSVTYLPEAEVPPFGAILHIPGKNLLLVSGGLTDDKTNSSDVVTVYDAAAEGVAIKENLLMSHGRVGHAAVELSGGEIALIGGTTKTPIEVVSLETVKGVPVEIIGDASALPFVFFSLTPLKNADEFLFSGGNKIISDKPLAV
ncbi:MAG: hypothetical protein FJ088_11170, partial [Deltaproteobacteria bacterium]|nr:hypothetical protein [Deltaproteobacteria bacterium]